MRRDLSFGFGLVVLAAFVGSGCTTPTIGSSTQAGSTLVIPFHVDSVAALAPLSPVGFGGSEFDDPQRGELVVHLDSETGFALETRLALLVLPPVESELGPHSFAGGNLLLMVDVPAGAPPGTHGIVLVHEREVDGGVETTVIPAPQTIKILPNQVLAGSELVTGEPTPSEIFWAGAWYPLIGVNQNGPFNNYAQAVPEPSFGVRVTSDTGVPPAGSAPRFIAYAKVEIDYPEDVIDVKRVVSAEPMHTVVSWEDDGDVVTAWTLTKKRHAPLNAGFETALADLKVVFSLDDPETELLDLADVTVTLLDVRDQFGAASIEQDWQIAASTTSIR